MWIIIFFNLSFFFSLVLINSFHVTQKYNTEYKLVETETVNSNKTKRSGKKYYEIKKERRKTNKCKDNKKKKLRWWQNSHFSSFSL